MYDGLRGQIWANFRANLKFLAKVKYLIVLLAKIYRFFIPHT